jgi:thioesterase domain-containing protein
MEENHFRLKCGLNILMKILAFQHSRLTLSHTPETTKVKKRRTRMVLLQVRMIKNVSPKPPLVASNCSHLATSKDALEEQERKRLEALRQRDQDRAKRFIDAKNRSIGIDKSYLDLQVEEKRLKELAEREEKLREGEFEIKYELCSICTSY